MSFEIRTAHPEDRAAVLELVPRLRAFGPDLLRSPESLDDGERRTLNRFFTDPLPHAHLWIAAGIHGRVLGAAYAERMNDYFTQEPYGHLGILMVSGEAEGQGIGRALMGAVEHWSRTCGFRFLTLNVFAGNVAARRFYEHAGFHTDIVRYTKPLASDPPE